MAAPSSAALERAKEPIEDWLQKHDAETIDEVLRTEFVGQVRAIMRGLLQSQLIQNDIKEFVRSASLDIAKEILAEDGEALEADVRRALKERWPDMVESAAKARLEAALQDVCRKLSG
jgi:exoribonuclease II